MQNTIRGCTPIVRHQERSSCQHQPHSPRRSSLFLQKKTHGHGKLVQKLPSSLQTWTSKNEVHCLLAPAAAASSQLGVASSQMKFPPFGRNSPSSHHSTLPSYPAGKHLPAPLALS